MLFSACSNQRKKIYEIVLGIQMYVKCSKSDLQGRTYEIEIQLN